MHFITGVITLIPLLALTFAVPIIPTPLVSSVTATLKLATLTEHPHPHPPPTGAEVHYSGAFTQHTGSHSYAPQTGTHSWTHPTGTYEGNHHHSGTHTWARPTATIYHKPTASSAKYGRVAEAEPVSDFEPFVRSGMEGNELAGATNVREGSATDGGCVWECFQLACECVNAGGKSALISKTIVGLALVGAAAAVLA